MNTNSSKRNKDSQSSEKDIQDASTGSVTNVGDISRDITDTADVARASIAKGRVGVDKGSKTVSTTAADMARGQIEGNQSIIQGATTRTIATPNTATEDDDNNISRDKVVSSGTSFDEDKSIDKADIYSTEENGTRHLERAQEKPVEKVENKEKGSWRIKERREEEE
jgi:hypothetical protein